MELYLVSGSRRSFHFASQPSRRLNATLIYLRERQFVSISWDGLSNKGNLFCVTAPRWWLRWWKWRQHSYAPCCSWHANTCANVLLPHLFSLGNEPQKSGGRQCQMGNDHRARSKDPNCCCLFRAHACKSIACVCFLNGHLLLRNSWRP